MAVKDYGTRIKKRKQVSEFNAKKLLRIYLFFYRQNVYLEKRYSLSAGVRFKNGARQIDPTFVMLMYGDIIALVINRYRVPSRYREDVFLTSQEILYYLFLKTFKIPMTRGIRFFKKTEALVRKILWYSFVFVTVMVQFRNPVLILLCVVLAYYAIRFLAYANYIKKLNKSFN